MINARATLERTAVDEMSLQTCSQPPWLPQYTKQPTGIHDEAKQEPLLQPIPAIVQEVFFFEGELIIQVIWSGLSHLHANTRHVHSHQRRASRAPSPEGTFLLVASPTFIQHIIGTKAHYFQEVIPRLIPRSPASETNCRSPAVFRAAAEAAKKKRSSGQYATTEIGHAASELQKGQRAIWGPCVEIRGHQRAQEVEQLAAAGVVRAAKAAEVGRGSAKLQRQDAANVVWAARAAEVGRTGSRGAQSPDCRRLAKPECRGKKKPPEGDVKSSRSSMSLQTLVAKKGQLSESLSSGSC
ncbi:hypothetical protein IWW34DRAFT_838127 [Fusarium oxysporum f. sp. albedinis]|nr:hypothetical protein IWW34DRAFT_838127 [Fusarium oxysporum f. sp. albedinis]